MTEITDLGILIASLSPKLTEGEFVFLTFPKGSYGDGAELAPIAALAEEEGLTLVVPREKADHFSKKYSGVFRQITLDVYSSLSAVGLTGAVTSKLAERGIAANVVAAFHHDHIFVPVICAAEAIDALDTLVSAEKT